MDRRKFIKTTVAAGIAAGVGPSLAKTPDPIPKRPLGKTGEKLSIVGLGGISIMHSSQEHANRSVTRAVECGINYFDVAPTYGKGLAEERLGAALEPYRKDAFLACKTTRRTAAEAAEELHTSLKRLHTDYFDLYQLHAIRTLEDVETALGPNGAMETFLNAQKEDKIRYLGFAAHSVEAALAAMERFDFDTTLFPINYALWTRENFGPQVIGLAREKGMGILVLKAQCRGRWSEETEKHHPPCWYEPVTDLEETRLALNFALSQGATATVPPGNEELFWMAVDLAYEAKPITRAEEQRLRVLTANATPLFTYASS